MKITLQNNLTQDTLWYMDAEPLPDTFECTQIPVLMSEARKAIGIIGVFKINIPYSGKYGFTVKAIEYGQDFALQIVSWDNDKFPVDKDMMTGFKASLLKELHLAIASDVDFLNTVNEVKKAGTANYVTYRQQKKLSTTNILGDTVTEDNQAVI